MRKKDLQELVRICENEPDLGEHLKRAHKLKAGKDGRFHNSLSGLCVRFSGQVAEAIRTHVPEAKPIKRTSRLHTCLEYETDDAGVLVVDSTLGQFTVSRHFFCGNETQLRTAFLNQHRRFLPGATFSYPIEVVLQDAVVRKGTTMTREDWFDVIYQPLYRYPFFT